MQTSLNSIIKENEYLYNDFMINLNFTFNDFTKN